MPRILARLLVSVTLAVTGQATAATLGETIDVGETGFAVRRPVMAAACPHGCPWGELGEFVRDAMKTLDYEVILCRNCNRSYGPGLVARRDYPPELDEINLFVGTTQRVDARVDFGVTATDNLAWAYKGIWRYADEGPYDNLRLIARIDDPRWLMIAVKADTGITDLGEIRERRLGVDMLVNLGRPAIQKLFEYYDLSEQQIVEWGGSIARASIRNTDAGFDIIISNNASPANNPEVAYWTAYTYRHDLHFLSLPEDLLNQLATDDLALERATAQWGLLRGVDRSIDTVIRNGHAIFGRDDMPDDVAYDIARAVYRHRRALESYIRPYSYNSATVTNGFGVPLHPGARRFYEEMGFLQPACIPEFKRMPGPSMYRAARAPAIPADRIEEEFEVACSALGSTYRTTLNVTRPRRDEDNSHVVVVEPTHPGNLWPVRSTTSEYLAHEGHVSVTVNSSSSVVERLVKKADPERYADLSVPSAPRIESEILHQVAVAIERGALGIEAPTILLSGYSNTGDKVRSYIDYFRHRYDDTYDGFLVGQTAVGTMPGPIPDLRVPVIELQGERELIATLKRNPNGLTFRRPDGGLFRLYEVPGMAHLDTSDPERLSFPPSICGIDTASSFPLDHVWANVLDALVKWTVDGKPAPAAPRIAFEEDGKTIRRDEHGNALGGMRLPWIEIPTSTMHTVSDRNPDYPRARCDMIGPEFPFGPNKLKELYGSHREYMRRFKRALDEAIDDGRYLGMYRQEALKRARETRARFER